jgi:hypothetical protein
LTPTAPPPDPLFQLPNLDDIRAAIAAADERARLLRLALRLRLHLTTADRLPAPVVGERGGTCG